MKQALLIIAATALAVIAPATAAQATPPPTQLCNPLLSLCMNRQGGSTAGGTHILAWTQGDPNNDFEWKQLASWCNNGHVEVYPGGGCPFAIGSGLNSLYNGALIVQEENSNSTPLRCAANGNSYGGYERAQLQNCGSNGYVWILGDCNDINTCNESNQVISLFWTNQTVNHATIQCEAFDAKGQQIIMNDGCELDSYSAFDPVYFV